jgi:hypothetical protein
MRHCAGHCACRGHYTNATCGRLLEFISLQRYCLIYLLTMYSLDPLPPKHVVQQSRLNSRVVSYFTYLTCSLSSYHTCYRRSHWSCTLYLFSHIKIIVHQIIDREFSGQDRFHIQCRCLSSLLLPWLSGLSPNRTLAIF